MKLEGLLPADRIKTRLIDRVSYASDAGFYYLLPKAIVQPVGEDEIISLFKFSRTEGIPLVFRTGGTSLSGQSITDGILVDLSRHWQRITTEAEGHRVRVQPGITGAMVNAHLRKHRRKIGPDPSSISAAMMGGILSNNASGMCCGVAQNAYHTVRYIRFILPDGKAYTTEDPADYARFVVDSKELYDGIRELRRIIHSDPALFGRIREKFRTKTTIGYSLNAFIDHEHPLDIFAHLLIGAEGTLAFISEAVLDTVPDHPYKSTALLYFPDIYAACQAIPLLTAGGAAMAELMDRASLRAVADLPGMPAVVKTLPDAAAALLIEFQEATTEALQSRVDVFMTSSADLSLLHPPAFTIDPREQDFFWKVRKGLFPAVGAVRARGTTVILEDLAFPVGSLGDAILDLQELFRKYEYDNAIIFGHAKDGNIHFVVTQSFNTPEETDRYDRFIRDVVDLVVHRHRGTLKAEHGTGRNMAPFVETEWGGDAYAIIRRIKQLTDPAGLLNPGVIVNDDAQVHIRNLKQMPEVEEEVDRCIECGYCEHRCPSRDLTATPRRRIVIRRVLKNMELAGDSAGHAQLLREYGYDGLDTCAVDGLCATACPVDINTGDLVKRLRRENHSPFANRVALLVARNFRLTERLVRLALQAGSGIDSLFGTGTMTRVTTALRKVSKAIPLWSAQLGKPPKRNHAGSIAEDSETDPENSIVYFPACISRVMGSYKGREKSLTETFTEVCRKAGIAVVIPGDIEGSCCSQIYGSKGFTAAQRHTAAKTVAQLWRVSRGGRLPVVTDVSSCAYTLQQLRPLLDEAHREKYDRLRLLDSVEFLHDMVLPRARVRPADKDIVLHPVCSTEKMKTGEKLLRVAGHFAARVTVPRNAGCCGMAGDRGFLFPELTMSATRAEAEELSQKQYDGHYSTTKTCEMAMSEALKRDYESILYLADEVMH